VVDEPIGDQPTNVSDSSRAIIEKSVSYQKPSDFGFYHHIGNGKGKIKLVNGRLLAQANFRKLGEWE